MKKLLFIVPLIILLVTAGMLLKKRRAEVAETPLAAPLLHTVRTVEPQTRSITQTSSFLAELQAAKSAAISSKLSGQITRLPVHENQRVQAGQLLVKIDEREIVAGLKGLQARLQAADQQLQYARTQYQRNLALFQAGGLAEEQLEASAVARSSAQATVQELQQNINSLKSQFGYVRIKAPFDGVVGTILLRQGDLATPGRTILNFNSLPQKLTFRFSAGQHAIRPGQPVLQRGRKIGVVSRLYAEAANGLSIAEVTPEQRLELPSGSFLSLDVVTGSASGCSLPLQSLLHRADGVSIMQYQQQRFVETPVSVALQDADFALLSPCPSGPVAVASEAKLSLLPGYGAVKIIAGSQDE